MWVVQVNLCLLWLLRFFPAAFSTCTHETETADSVPLKPFVFPSSPCFPTTTRLFALHPNKPYLGYEHSTFHSYTRNKSIMKIHIHTNSLTDLMYFKYANHVWRFLIFNNNFNPYLYADFMHLALDALKSITQKCLPTTFAFSVQGTNASGSKASKTFFLFLTLLIYSTKSPNKFQLNHLSSIIDQGFKSIQRGFPVASIVDDMREVLQNQYNFQLTNTNKEQGYLNFGYEVLHLIYNEKDNQQLKPIFSSLWNIIRLSSDPKEIKCLSIIYQRAVLKLCENITDYEQNDNVNACGSESFSDVAIDSLPWHLVQGRMNQLDNLIDDFKLIHGHISPILLEKCSAKIYRKMVRIFYQYSKYLDSCNQNKNQLIRCARELQRNFNVQFIYFLNCLCKSVRDQNVTICDNSFLLKSHDIFDPLHHLLNEERENEIHNDSLDESVYQAMDWINSSNDNQGVSVERNQRTDQLPTIDENNGITKVQYVTLETLDSHLVDEYPPFLNGQRFLEAGYEYRGAGNNLHDNQQNYPTEKMPVFRVDTFVEQFANGEVYINQTMNYETDWPNNCPKEMDFFQQRTEWISNRQPIYDSTSDLSESKLIIDETPEADAQSEENDPISLESIYNKICNDREIEPDCIFNDFNLELSEVKPHLLQEVTWHSLVEIKKYLETKNLKMRLRLSGQYFSDLFFVVNGMLQDLNNLHYCRARQINNLIDDILSKHKLIFARSHADRFFNENIDKLVGEKKLRFLVSYLRAFYVKYLAKI